MSSGRVWSLQLDLPALSEGRHRIMFDGSLGPSLDVSDNYLDVAPALERSTVEVLVRADGAVGEAKMWINCGDGEFGAVDISVKQAMRAGSRFTYHPVVGHECSVQLGPLDPQGGGFSNNWRHLTTGFYDVDGDPSAANMLDFDDWSRSFTVDAESTGVAAYLVEYDKTVVWTYSCDFGSPLAGEGSPISLQCADGTQTYRSFLGYWYRSIVDRNGCTISHTPSPGTHPQTTCGSGPTPRPVGSEQRGIALMPWLSYYNNRRPHSALGYNTPNTRLEESRRA